MSQSTIIIKGTTDSLITTDPNEKAYKCDLTLTTSNEKKGIIPPVELVVPCFLNQLPKAETEYIIWGIPKVYWDSEMGKRLEIEARTITPSVPEIELEPRISIIGRLGKDPELAFLPSDKIVARLSLAVNSRKNGQNITSWYPVSFWGKKAETVNKYLKKGDYLGVLGIISLEYYEDNTGNRKQNTKVIGTDFNFISIKQQENNNSFGEQRIPVTPAYKQPSNQLDDEICF